MLNTIIDNEKYNKVFYGTHNERRRASANKIVDLILKMMRVNSVIDVGCGRGYFLKAFLERGVNDLRGLDGDWLDDDLFIISNNYLTKCDLTRPIKVDRKFDLAMSCEVAEHLPEARADAFIDSLTALAPIVLFSAAIPKQGGTNHVNEQWQSYWKDKFSQRSFYMIDCLRYQLWAEDSVEHEYKQNMLLYVHKDKMSDFLAIKEECEKKRTFPLDIVHPKQLRISCWKAKTAENISLRELVKVAPRVIFSAMSKRVKKICSSVN